MFDIYIKQSFYLVVIISGLPLVAGSIIGLVISIFQTATQIQEQSLSFLAKLIAVSVVIACAGSWFSSEIISFMQEVLKSIGNLGRM